MTVVYIDVLFFINLCMDFLALALAGAFMHLEARRVRLLFASAVGGTYAVLAALFPGNAAIGALIGIGAACLLCYIAYGPVCRGKIFWCLFALFYGMSWLLGGMITGAYELLRGFFEKRSELLLMITEGEGKISFFFLLMLVCAFFLTLLKRHLYFKKEEKCVEITIKNGGAEASLSALVDSGCTLCDPLSGRPCILISPAAAAPVIPTDVLRISAGDAADLSLLSEHLRRRIRLIPAATVGGHRLLIGYRADRITVTTGGSTHATDAFLVIGNPGEEYCGHAALIPSILA